MSEKWRKEKNVFPLLRKKIAKYYLKDHVFFFFKFFHGERLGRAWENGVTHRANTFPWKPLDVERTVSHFPPVTAQTAFT